MDQLGPPARTLTCRECFQALDGLIKSLATDRRIGGQRIRQLMKFWVESTAPWLPVRGQGERWSAKTQAEIQSLVKTAIEIEGHSFDEAAQLASRSLAGLVCGLRTMSHEEEVRSALAHVFSSQSWKFYE